MREHPTDERLKALRQKLSSLSVDGFIQPMNDAFQSEYVPDADARIPWLTGFTGSAGTLVITQNDAVLFVDGRYTLQAENELDTRLISYFNIADLSLTDWLEQHMDSALLGYDATLHTPAQRKQWESHGIETKPIENPVDAIWADRPSAPCGEITEKSVELAGLSREEKIQSLIKKMDSDADACFVALPDAVNWLLNIRGNDIPYNPLLLSEAVIWRDGSVDVFVNSSQVEPLKALLGALMQGLNVHSIAARGTWLKAQGNITFQYDPSQTSCAVIDAMADAEFCEASDPVTYLKAVKNEIEIQGMKKAHEVDGIAVSHFIDWLKEAVKSKAVTELEASAKLEEFRKQHPDYTQPSFTTISGAGPNGAIVHYRVTEESNLRLGKDTLYLVDSGGQYPYGTTDITRTIAIGTPSEEMKTRYTQVLKGHIALADAVFPTGTTGAELDVLARQYLWQDGVDYAHGTGHGVGHHLCVHEGPQGISRRSNKVALQAGMILSNEPGYYKNGEYGIRIENLILVIEKGKYEDGRTRLGFETITLAPLDEALIDRSLLTSKEVEWLKHYHARVERLLSSA